MLMDFLHRRGFGVFEADAFDSVKKTFTIRVRGSFNAIDYKRVKRPVCYVLSGMLAGILEPIVKVTLECRETKCIAVGSDFCEFELSPSKKNEFPRDYFKAKPLKEVRGLREVELEFDRERGILIFACASQCH